MQDKYLYLDKIDSPSDLKKLPADAMPVLAAEIRDFLVGNVSVTGGHLSSNLGVVELTLALHRVFDAPRDHIIWDVGHQCYTHKIITGRKNIFKNLRTIGGLSGFTNSSESEYDCFGAGHSSTSLSAALGFAKSEYLNGTGNYTVAVVGDGAYTGGMIHEALNNVRRDLKLIIILNENEMSISKNIGSFAKYIAKIRSSKGYYKHKRRTARIILKMPLIGRFMFRSIRKAKQILKNIIYSSNYFEELGLYYLGPADGNYYDTAERLLREAKEAGQSVIIQLKTKKGKGYPPAEKDPDLYHSISGNNGYTHNFSEMMGEYLVSMAAEHSDICAITASMCDGTGLKKFRSEYGKRFFDVGIAEEHALTFCAGLAAAGKKPFFAVYSSFLQRGYDNIIHDIALQKLPVTICIDRAGLNGSDGPTHHGIFDVTFLSPVPGITIYTPPTYDALKLALEAAYESKLPAAIRYSNCDENRDIVYAFYPYGINSLKRAVADFKPEDGKKKIIITYGRIAEEALKAEHILGESAGTILLEMLKPYDLLASAVASLLPVNEAEILFLEEGIKAGGAGMLLGSELAGFEIMKNKHYKILAVDDTFTPIIIDKNVYKAYGISAEEVIMSFKK